MMAPVKHPFVASPPPVARDPTKSNISTASSVPLALSKPVKKTKKPTLTSATTTATIDLKKPASASNEEDTLRKEAEAQARKLAQADQESATTKPHEAIDRPQTDTAPLGKLATRMKSLLRRNASEKKKDKEKNRNKKEQQEFDRLEDAHWSEM